MHGWKFHEAEGGPGGILGGVAMKRWEREYAKLMAAPVLISANHNAAGVVALVPCYKYPFLLAVAKRGA